MAQAAYSKILTKETSQHKTEDTPLKTDSSRTYLNINRKGNDQTRDYQDLEDDNFPPLKSEFDWQTHNIHSTTVANQYIYVSRSKVRIPLS